jgi:hypothetical protein
MERISMKTSSNPSQQTKKTSSILANFSDNTSKGKSERLNNRAERVMGRAQKNWSKAQDALNYDETSKAGTSNAVAYASQKLNKSARQAEKAQKLKAKAASYKK